VLLVIPLACSPPTAATREQKVDNLLLLGYPRTAQRCYERALEFKELQEPGHAIRYLSEAISLDPAFTDAYVERADLYIFRESYGRARSDIAKVIRLAPDDPRPNTLLGIILIMEGHFRTAAQELSTSIEKDPTYPLAYAWLGYVCEQEGSPQKAIQLYNDFLTYEPDSTFAAKVHFRLGKLYFTQQKLDKCEYHLSYAYRIEPRPNLETWIEFVRKAKGQAPGAYESPSDFGNHSSLR
jgi:tetratricopeptide (TPR) repeat protein